VSEGLKHRPLPNAEHWKSYIGQATTVKVKPATGDRVTNNCPECLDALSMPGQEPRQKYMIKAELAVEVAEMVGIESYDPEREAHGPADFRREEIEQIYKTITGENGKELSQREMNNVMMRELGTDLQSKYPFDLSRADLKVIHKALCEC